MKNLRQKKIFVVLISVLVLCFIAGAITMLVLHQREEALEEQQNEALQELYDNEGRYDPQSIVLSNTTKPRAENLAKAFGAELRITEDGRFAALTLPEGVTVFDIYENEEYRKYIEYMSLDYQAKISDLLASDGEDGEVSDEKLPIRPQYTVNDTDYNRQTYLDYLNMSNVWSKTKGSGITVAVIDTGIDTDHPEFAGRISEYSYNATEDKIVKDYVLSDGSLDWSLVEDGQGHGTAVAGVIAASMNGNGVVGIAPQVNIIVIKAECNEKGEFKRTSDLVFGLYYAIERDVAVVNMSFGVVSAEDPFAEPAQLAFDSDVICVAAAGNSATANLTWPAAGENVFGVGALAQDSWELAAYSNYGENVDFVAPGTVYTTQMGGGYGGMDGTSFSSPITAGVLALYMSQNKYSEFNTIEELLYASCYDLGDLGPDFYYGYGALDVSALMLEERGKVTFNMMTDELDNTEQVFIRSHTLQNMPEPERLYAIFDGWYYDPQCTDEYVWYEDEFHGDLTLYANWVNEDDGIPFTYVELEDGTIEIRSYTGHRRYITIPDYIDGKVVSSIGEFAFAGETRLREVKLPKYLKRIRLSAFEGCSNLVSMEIPDTVTEIGAKAFYDNVRLSTLIFGENSQLVSIGGFAFSGCAKMRTFTVPTKVTTLNATAFYRNTSMIAYDVQNGNTAFTAKDGVLFNYTGSTLVCYPAGLKGAYTVPENVRTVGDYAFACTRLSSVELSNVETLGGAAFAYGFLESIVIPDSVISMGGSVFAYNGSLRSAELGAGLTSISGGAFAETALTSIDIPAGIRSIEKEAFSHISNLAQVTFAPDSTLAYIGEKAFFDSGVKSVEIPASVITIKTRAFGTVFFPNLTSLTFEENSVLHTIGESAFENQYWLTSVNLPEHLVRLDDYAFRDTGLVTVEIPESVTHFGAGVFASCHSLENIFVEDGNQNYVDVDGVVYNTDKTALVEYPAGNARTSYSVLEGVTDINDASFYGSWNLTSVNLSSTVTTVCEHAFYDCERVTKYGLSDALTYIQAYAFSKNYCLRALKMPDSLMQISNFAFAEDWSLYSVTFTENSKLPRISYGAFANCGLASFRVPANVSTMAQGAFMGCSNLQSFTFAENSKLKSISGYMFDGCSNLRTIKFEKGSALTSIQAHGLEGMRNLISIDFGDAKLTSIDNFAFRCCESLTRFDIPEGVTFLGRYAFYYCTKLSEVTVPSTVDYIGRFAFLGTEDLNVYFAAESLPANLAEDWDHGTAGYYLGVANVITEGEWEYARLTNGGIAILKYNGTAAELDLSALELGGDIVNIGSGAFAGSTVESIVLPDSLQLIQAEAFWGSPLKSVSIPANVVFIGRSAFAETPIESLTFAPDARIERIEQSAFENTKELDSVTIPSSVTTMGRAIFKGSGMTSLSFAADISVTEIPQEAFAYTHISTVTIPNSVTLINHSAFCQIEELNAVSFGSGENLKIMSNVFYRSGLKTVHIPANVCSIGEYAFVALPNLTEFTVSDHNPFYKTVDGLLTSKDGHKLITVPAGRTGSMTVPEGIEVIGFGAFEGSKLSEIRFLDNANILSFGYRAFYNADGITEMHIPASVVTIDYYAFAMCDNLHTVTFAEDNKLKGIYEGAFYGCKNLSDIMLPDSVVEISDFAFYGCRKLTDFPVSETTGLKGIYDYAFAYTGFSGDYTIPKTLLDIGAYAFMGNKFTSVVIPNTNAWDLAIGIGAFAECNELTEITVPFIGGSFEDDTFTWFGYIFGAGDIVANSVFVPNGLKKVTIEEGITHVGYGAFYGLAGLEEIRVPHSVQWIYDYAFYNTSAKYELTNEITFVWDNYYEIRYEANYRHSGSGLLGKLRLSDRVTGIDRFAFKNCEGLTSVTIPDSITVIGREAFYGCKGLTSVTIGNGVEIIESGAFQGCSVGSVFISDLDKWMRINFKDNESNPLHCGAALYVNGDLVTELVIPANVTRVGNSAFTGCDGLVNVVIPDGVTIIGNSAFSNCYKLKDIAIPDSVTIIGNSAFSNCDKLKDIAIPDSVTSIGNSAFYSCRDLADITLPEGMTSLGSSVFENCINLTSVTLPESLTSIGYRALSGCWSLTDIVIPARVTSIGNGAFSGCSSLYLVENHSDLALSCGSRDYGSVAYYAKVLVDKDGNKVYAPNSDGVVYYNTSEGFWFEYQNGKYTLKAYLGSQDTVTLPTDINGESYEIFQMRGVTHVIIPEGMTSIGHLAFDSCGSLKSVVIPDSVTHIGASAFQDCCNLTNVHLPRNIRSIDYGAFCYCINLTSIIIPDGVTSIGDYAFYNCESLTKIHIPDRVTSIGDHAFNGCKSLTSITIPDHVTCIEGDAFGWCDNLTNIHIPESVTKLDSSAFANCNAIITVHENNPVFASVDGVIYNKNKTEIFYVPQYKESITIPATVTDISHVFQNHSLIKTVAFEPGSKITRIGENAFSGCVNLTNITIPDSVVNIGRCAFQDCTGLTSITIPDSIVNIDNYAFRHCTGLTSITVPGSVARICENAFYECDSLTDVTILDGVKSIGYSAFGNCVNLESILLPDSITEIGDYAFDNCRSLSRIVIPDGITCIGNSTFRDCVGLKSITIPDGVTALGLSGCTGLNSLTIPESVTSLYLYRCIGLTSLTVPDGVTNLNLTGCTSLTSLTVPDGVTSLNLSMCIGLTSVIIPDSVTSIDDHAFYGCRSLTSVTIPASVTCIGSSAFSECVGLTSITIPDSVTSIGSSAFSGCVGLTSIHIPNSVTSIGDYVFRNCGSLSYATLPDNMTCIGNGLFYNCVRLTSVSIPDSVTSIGDESFCLCAGLTSITIPNRVTDIGNHAFYWCGGLTSITVSENVTEIGEDAFGECPKLYFIKNLSDLPLNCGSTDYGQLAYHAKVLTDKEGNVTLASDSAGITNYLTAEGFLFECQNGKYTLKAYYGNQDTVVLPETINGESYTINRMQGVKNVVIPEGVTSIDEYAFLGCVTLTSIVIPDSVAYIGKSAFWGCSSLIDITIPDGVTSIGDYMFSGCGSLVRVTIPDSVRSIGRQGFQGCSSLVSIKLPDSVTDIGPQAFFGCTGLESITIPHRITRICDETFVNCSSMKNVTMSGQIFSIGVSAFYGCESLVGIELPDSVVSIGRRAFWGCKSLIGVYFGENSRLSDIGDDAFSRCESLNWIELPDSVKNLGEDVFLNTAYFNTPDNWVDGCLYSGNCLIMVDSSATYIVKESITTYAHKALKNARKIKKVVIGGDYSGILYPLTNVETLFITQMPSFYIYQYFGSGSDSIPLTLKSIVLSKDVRMNSTAFKNITGITIYVEDTEANTRWDENYPGWNNGNKVVYGDEWITADFFDQNGNVLSSEIFLTHQVIRQPYLALEEGLEETQVLVGWDLDGDGKPDTVPATSTSDIEARPIVETRVSEYTVRFLAEDGVTMIAKSVLPYGALIVPPAIEDRIGYTVNGWIGYSDGMTVGGNHVFVLDRTHNGNGHEYAEPVWVAPTCSERGYNKHVCEVCGEWYATDYMQATGHDYRSETTNASCVENGMNHYACTVCGHAYSEIIPARGHDYKVTVTKNATCSEYGEARYVCAYCGDCQTEATPMMPHNYQKRTAPKWWLQILIERILNIILGYEGENVYYFECVDCRHIQTADEATDSGVSGIQSSGCTHQLSDWMEYIAPDCEGEGVDAKFCIICGEAMEYRRDGEALGHDYSEHIFSAPTCTKEGYTIHSCSRCKDTYTDSITEALGHKPGAEATCQIDQICTVCGEVLTEKLSHDYVSVKTAPTCTDEGYTTHTCSRCEYTYIDSVTEMIAHSPDAEPNCLKNQTCTVCGEVLIEMLGHDYEVIEIPPTCTEEGCIIHTCSRCKDSYTSNVTGALGHIEGAAADCQNDQICVLCGIQLAEKLGHAYVAKVTAPTCTEDGYTTHICERCGDQRIDSVTSANGHTPNKKYPCMTDILCEVCNESIPTASHDDYSVTKAPTCTEQGYTTHTCLVCGETRVDNYTEALNHEPGRWIIDKEAKIGVAGERHRDCDRCGITLETEIIPALEKETTTPSETKPQLPDSTHDHLDGNGGCASSSCIRASLLMLIMLISLSMIKPGKKKE